MSNYLAVATVTATLAWMLREAETIVPHARVTFIRPDKLEHSLTASEAGVNIYLYLTTTNPFFRNEDLPTRGRNGTDIREPHVSINLSYLLTFYGDDMKLEPQRLLGWTETVLEADAVLTPRAIERAVKEFHDYVGGSTLAGQVQRITIAPIPMSLDDLSKTWSTFRVPYMLSTSYLASVVLMSPMQPPPTPALPVRERRLVVFQGAAPRIESIAPQAVGPAGDLTITGHGFPRDSVVVELSGGRRVEVRPESSTRITLTLPRHQPAGLNSLNVVTDVEAGPASGAERRPLFRSNAAAFVVQARITHMDLLNDPPILQVAAEPPILSDQAVTLWLEEVPSMPGAQPCVIGLDRLPPGTARHIRFDRSTVPPGTYLARLRVDQSESAPDPNAKVTIP